MSRETKERSEKSLRIEFSSDTKFIKKKKIIEK